MESFNGKTVFIVGATGGIGENLVREFSAKGANLVLFSRNQEKLDSLKESLDSEYVLYRGDALDFDDLKNAVDSGIRRFGKIDAVVHAVGSIVLKSLQNLSLEEFRETLEINLVSPFLTIKAVLPYMIQEREGSVIVISSVAGSKGLINHEAVSAAKGGLESMIRSAAVTYAKRGIRFNGVALGLVDTPLSRFITGNEISMKASKAIHPVGRIGSPEDISPAIIYLASEKSKWTTGTIIHVDGGMSAN